MSGHLPIPNVYIVGPQSTGKTSLVNKLRSEVGNWLNHTSIDEPQIVSEVARTVLSKHNFTAVDVKSSPQRCFTLQKLILDAQALAEAEALVQSRWFISDRSGVDPLVYTKRYVSAEAALDLQRQDTWIEVRARMADSLIVVCESGTPWLTDDGIRLMPESREEWLQLFKDFCEVLDGIGLQYSVVPRDMLDISERATFVHSKWVERHGSTKHDKIAGCAGRK